MIKRYFMLLAIVLIALPTVAQEWVVPAENMARLSPAAFSDSTRKAGADLYNANCKSCHGDPGKNNVIKLVPPPPDVASEKLQLNSDGALHYKIAEGKSPMPSFKNILSASNIWYVISYIRSFNEKYVQKIEIKGSGPSVANAKIKLEWLKESNQVALSVSALKDKVVQPVSGAELKLFAKRYFGNLPVDQPRTTDLQGKALFTFPKDLPGDSTGLVQLTAKFADEAAFGEAHTDTTMAIGVPTYRAPLNESRALWNVVQKTPIWLLLAYTFSVLAAWGFIIYVFLQIRAIYMSGLKKE